MLSKFKRDRIIQSTNECEHMLEKFQKKYENTIKCLKMEIAENEELGNAKSANMPWVEYALHDLELVNRYKANISKLKKMLDEL